MDVEKQYDDFLHSAEGDYIFEILGALVRRAFLAGYESKDNTESAKSIENT